jgi:hypothetical protein
MPLQTVMQSFLGVGAPEAILVAVVALVVFGPKGLADVSVLRVWLYSTTQQLLSKVQLTPTVTLQQGRIQQPCDTWCITGVYWQQFVHIMACLHTRIPQPCVPSPHYQADSVRQYTTTGCYEGG